LRWLLALRVVRYLGELTTPRTILWCYLLWYLVVVSRYFDPHLQLWLTSVGLSAIVGFALLLNAASGATSAKLGGWQKARFFMAPFCVSSFAALAKGHGFILVFSPRPADLAWGFGTCASFLLLRYAAGRGREQAGAHP